MVEHDTANPTENQLRSGTVCCFLAPLIHLFYFAGLCKFNFDSV